MPGSPGQGRVLWVATGHRIGGTGVVRRSGGGGAGQVNGCPQHQVADVTHWMENLQRKLQDQPAEIRAGVHHGLDQLQRYNSHEASKKKTTTTSGKHFFCEESIRETDGTRTISE